MLFKVRRAAETSVVNALDIINNGVDSVNLVLTTMNKGLFWCSDQINKNMSLEAKAAWIEHQAQLHGFSSADAEKKYREAEQAVTKTAEEAEIKKLEEQSKGEVKKEKTTKSGS